MTDLDQPWQNIITHRFCLYSPLQLVKFMFSRIQIEIILGNLILCPYKFLDWTGRVFLVIVLMQYEAIPKESGGIFLNIGRKDGFVPFQINSATVIIHEVISKDERVCSRDSHAMTTPPSCFTDEAVCLGSFAVPFFSPHFCSPITLFIFVSSVHKHSSKTLLAHLCAFLQTLILPFYFWCWSKVCIFL